MCAVWDDMSVVIVTASCRSKNRFVCYLPAIIIRCEILAKFTLLAFFISTHHNHPADDITREMGQ